ncbi:MAG TPA: DNA methyltransferase [Caulobacteraceae bacterium]
MTEYETLCARTRRQAADRAVTLGYVEPPCAGIQLELLAPERSSDLAQTLADFTFNGQKTLTEKRNGIAFHFNEFWTARQRQAHSIHEVSYRACFKPQLPEFFISRLTEPGDRVYDPFMGRGTTPIQAALMGRTPIGNDINPLSVLLTRPRLRPPHIFKIAARLQKIDWRRTGAAENADLLVFYHPETLTEISSLRSYLSERDAAGTLDEIDDWIRMVALNRLTGHSPGFFSVYSLPPNQAVSIESQRRINEKRNQSPSRRSVPEIILKKSKSLLSDGAFGVAAPPLFTVGPAERTPEIESGSIQLVVTSPPFLDIVQYAADNWLRCWFADIDVSSVNITMHKKTPDWSSFVARTFVELSRVVKAGGYVAFEVGEVRNGKVCLEELVIDSIDNNSFEIEHIMVNVQEFTKTANCWGVENNSKGTNTNRIVLARRRG